MKIGGVFNTNANDGTITRFGWKAQNKSLLIFSGEAYNVEQGVSNENFPNERSAVPGCVFNGSPEDSTNLLNPDASSPNFGTKLAPNREMSSDVVNFAAYHSPLSAGDARCSHSVHSKRSRSVQLHRLQSLPLADSHYRPFHLHRHVQCHLQPLFRLRSAHHGYRSGGRHPSGRGRSHQFRTAPLWGLGQRLFFLHDGRTTNLIQAIQSHSSSGSEANVVIRKFSALNASDMQDLLNFLRSL